jgi:23S rRNA-/tRNA-specific pseudouridylate synthase
MTLEGAKLFSALLRERKLEKTYLAIVEGSIGNEKIWLDALSHDKNARKTFVETNGAKTPEAKEAVTIVKTLASNDDYSLIEARIKTGRHHQIRAQAASRGHPLAGDVKYGARALPDTRVFFLHAWKIMFNAGDIPAGFPRVITAPLPEAFQAQIEALFGGHLSRYLRRFMETV